MRNKNIIEWASLFQFFYYNELEDIIRITDDIVEIHNNTIDLVEDSLKRINGYQ